jgi:hypothetical protein
MTVKVIHRLQKEKEAKRKKLWIMMDNPSGYPHSPQYRATTTSFFFRTP